MVLRAQYITAVTEGAAEMAALANRSVSSLSDVAQHSSFDDAAFKAAAQTKAPKSLKTIADDFKTYVNVAAKHIFRAETPYSVPSIRARNPSYVNNSRVSLSTTADTLVEAAADVRTDALKNAQANAVARLTAAIMTSPSLTPGKKKKLAELLAAGDPKSAAEANALIQEVADKLPAGKVQELLADAHDHGGGGLALDLDEAVHAVYVVATYAYRASEGGADFFQHFVEEARHLRENPMASLGEHLSPDGWADLGMSAGLTAVMIPLAWKAIHAGAHEFVEGGALYKALKKEQKALLSEAGTLEKLSGRDELGSGLQDFTKRAGMVAAQKAKDTKFVAKATNLGKWTGAWSFTSGLGIAAKSITDLGTKIGVGIDAWVHSGSLATGVHAAANPAAVSATAATAASAAGLGVTALSIPVAAAATALGGTLWKKFGKQAARAKNDIKIVNENPIPVTAKTLTPEEKVQIKNYQNFKNIKLDQRYKNLLSYKRWTAGFTTGAGAYTAATVVKAGLVGAAIGGVSGAVFGDDDDRGLMEGLVLGLTLLGGVGMMGASWVFLKGHGTAQRYERYVTRDFAGSLDRDLMAIADITPELGKDAGLKLRAAAFDQASKKYKLSQELLDEAASESKNKFKLETHKGDQPIDSDQRYGKGWDYARAALDGIPTSKWLPGSRTTIRYLKENVGQFLTENTLRKQWLADPNTYKRQINYMIEAMEAHGTYFQTQGHLRQGIMDVAAQGEGTVPVNSLKGGNGTKGEEALAANLDRLLEDMKAGLKQDDAQTAEALLLIEDLKTLRDGGSTSAEGLAALKQRFMAAMDGKIADPATPDAAAIKTIDKQFAHFLMDDQPDAYQDFRGIMLETEVQAGKLREAAAQARAEAEDSTLASRTEGAGSDGSSAGSTLDGGESGSSSGGKDASVQTQRPQVAWPLADEIGAGAGHFYWEDAQGNRWQRISMAQHASQAFSSTGFN